MDVQTLKATDIIEFRGTGKLSRNGDVAPPTYVPVEPYTETFNLKTGVYQIVLAPEVVVGAGEMGIVLPTKEFEEAGGVASPSFYVDSVERPSLTINVTNSISIDVDAPVANAWIG